MLASFSIAAVRWVLIGQFPDEIYILIFAQILHAVTFGAYHATSIELVHRFFKGRHQIRGQAIYGSISFGLGGALGSFYSGLNVAYYIFRGMSACTCFRNSTHL